MTIRRGEIWWAQLDPIRGSEQAGTRPVLVFQNDEVSKFTTTILAIPLTTNLRRTTLPSCVSIPQGAAGLTSTSVALCHQLRALDQNRLAERIGVVTDQTMSAIEVRVLYTLGIV